MTILIFLAFFFLIVFLFMQQEKFGRAAKAERLHRIQQSPHYKKGSFQNLSPTPQLTDGATFFSVLRDFFLKKTPNGIPATPLPSIKTDLHQLAPSANVFVWMGHSTYFIQLNGKKILVDPVLSGSASPLSFTTRSFAGTDIYTPADIPEIDYLFISHDHWDHLDFKTIKALRPKIKTILTGLGTGAHLEHWGIPASMIHELDWQESISPEADLKITALPARHFSGRGFKRNANLWVSFLVQTPGFSLYLGGDSGYDTHFAETGKKYGPIDLAILECGQYNQSWKHIHMLPHEVAMAAKDLQASRLVPVHWAKFKLSFHAWNEPVNLLTQHAGSINLSIPIIGYAMQLNQPHSLDDWWKNPGLSK